MSSSAYLLDAVSSPFVPNAAPARMPEGALSHLMSAVVERASLRATDIYDVLIPGRPGCAGQLTLDPAEEIHRAGWPVSVTTASVYRGRASGVQGLGEAAFAAMAGQQDLIIVATVDDIDDVSFEQNRRRDEITAANAAALAAELNQADLDGYGDESDRKAERAVRDGLLAPCEVGRVLDARVRGHVRTPALGSLSELPSMVTDGTAQPGMLLHTSMTVASRVWGGGACVVSSEAYLRRCGRPPLARIRRFATASSDRKAPFVGMYEAAVRVLMNETLNAPDIAVWEIYDGYAGAAVETAYRLGLSFEQVNVHGAQLAFGDAPFSAPLRALCSMLVALRVRDEAMGIIVYPAPGGSGAALLVERL